MKMYSNYFRIITVCTSNEFKLFKFEEMLKCASMSYIYLRLVKKYQKDGVYNVVKSDDDEIEHRKAVYYWVISSQPRFT